MARKHGFFRPHVAGLSGIYSTTLREGGGDIIRSIFADGTDGFYFDFSKTDRLFQATTGGALANDPGENIALALDSHSWAGKSYAALAVAQPELVSNGGFDADTVWSKGVGWTITGGQLVATIVGAGTNSNQNIGLQAGKSYYIEVDVASVASGSINVRCGFDNVSPTITTPGVYTFVIQRGSNAFIYVNAVASNTIAAINSISVKEIPGNNATQATTSAQPKWQTGGLARFDGSDDNLLTTLKFGAAGTILLRLKPTSVPALVVALGAQAASSDRVWVGADASGVAGRFANGAQMSSGVSLLNVDGTIGLRWDGTTVDLLVDGAVNVSQAQSGSATTLVSPAIGAFNANGSISNAMAGDFYYALIINKALTAAEIAAITNLWGTS